jgi:hypothetical protein
LGAGSPFILTPDKTTRIATPKTHGREITPIRSMNTTVDLPKS